MTQQSRKLTKGEISVRRANMFVARIVRKVILMEKKMEQLEKKADIWDYRHKQILQFFEKFYKLYNHARKKRQEPKIKQLMAWIDSLVNSEIWQELKKLEVEEKILEEQLENEEVIQNLDLIEELLKKED